MSERTLRPGWRQVRFGDVVRLATERVTDPATMGIERYVGLEHLEPGDLRIRRWGLVAEGTTFTTRFRPGQVLFGKRRAYQRKVAVADFEGVCSGDIYVLEPSSSDLLPELLPFICRSDAFFEHAVGTSAGSLSPRTNWTSLAAYEFALPPLREQHRIAGAATAACVAAESFREAGAKCALVRRAALFEFFGGRSGGVRSHISNGWPVATIGAVGNTQIGIRKHPGSLQGPNMRPYLRVANVLDGRIDFSDVLHINVPAGDLERCALRDGDILVNKGNSMNLVGRASLFTTPPEVDHEFYFQDHLMRFRASAAVLPKYVLAYLQHLLYTLQFTRIAVASTSIATIPADKFDALPIPVPPLSDQAALVRTLDTIDVSVLELYRRSTASAELVPRIDAGHQTRP